MGQLPCNLPDRLGIFEPLRGAKAMAAAACGGECGFWKGCRGAKEENWQEVNAGNQPMQVPCVHQFLHGHQLSNIALLLL